MSIQKQFILRYRTEGQVRFQIPASICDSAIAQNITNSILAFDGVYRVKMYLGQKKLSIRFNESTCEFNSLAKQLFELLAQLEKQGALTPKPLVTKTGLKEKIKTHFSKTKLGQWGQEKFSDAKETMQAAKVVGKIGMKKNAALFNDPEQTIIDFLNDILVLYLIKLHWHNITQHWILSPFKYRYEWTAVFYMFFLLMRSRRPKPK